MGATATKNSRRKSHVDTLTLSSDLIIGLLTRAAIQKAKISHLSTETYKQEESDGNY